MKNKMIFYYVYVSLFKFRGMLSPLKRAEQFMNTHSESQPNAEKTKPNDS